MIPLANREATNTPRTSLYPPVDPQILGRLRILRIGPVQLHLDGHTLVMGQTPIHITHKEFVILHQLMSNAGRVVTRTELLDHAWGPNRSDAKKCLDVYIRRLRIKIAADTDSPPSIRTVRKVGYIFDLPATPAAL